LLESEYIKKNNRAIFRISKIRELLVLSFDNEKKVFSENAKIMYDGLDYHRNELAKRDSKPNFNAYDELSRGNIQPLEEWFNKLYYFEYDSDNRIVLEKEIFDNLKNTLNILCENLGYVSILSVLSSALDNYKHKLYSETVIISWSIIEYFINKDWDTLVQRYRSQGRLDSNRKDKMESRDYTASVKSNILEMNGLIAYEDYQKMNKIRKARNLIAHDFSYSIYNNKVGDSEKLNEICGFSFDLIQKYLELKLGFR
ncbi:hypothetical protein, partial [Leptospira sp. id769339]|uniref:hypothetical protein n=1 Tax=Leptospira sp. id769339 TaxID=2864221 RepID=UPI00214ACF34